MADIPEKMALGGYQSFLQQYKGPIYVLSAQLFGVLMNVTTRLLEIEGNHGEGMHPFQVCHSLSRCLRGMCLHLPDPLCAHGYHDCTRYDLYVVVQDRTLSLRRS